MGIDLSLYPFDGNSTSGHTKLQLTRRKELWPKIQELPSKVIPEATGYISGKWQTVTEDQYGGPLQIVRAKDFVKLNKHNAVINDSINRAVWAYLMALKPQTKILLFWH